LTVENHEALLTVTSVIFDNYKSSDIFNSYKSQTFLIVTNHQTF